MGTHRTAKDDLPELLLQCRADRNLSLEDVGKAVGMSKKSLSDIELGRQKPGRKNRLKLEQFLRKHGYFTKAA